MKLADFGLLPKRHKPNRLCDINAIRKRLNADKRFALNLTATRPVPVWPAYLVRPAGLRG